MFLLICHELFYIVWHCEILNLLNLNTFPQLKFSELCSSFSNDFSGEFSNSDTINIQRPTYESSIPKTTRSYPPSTCLSYLLTTLSFFSIFFKTIPPSYTMTGKCRTGLQKSQKKKMVLELEIWLVYINEGRLLYSDQNFSPLSLFSCISFPYYKMILICLYMYFSLRVYLWRMAKDHLIRFKILSWYLPLSSSSQVLDMPVPTSYSMKNTVFRQIIHQNSMGKQ